MYRDARKLFGVFCTKLQEHKGALNWAVPLNAFIGQGLEQKDIEPALSVLKRKGLIGGFGDGLWKMTELGADAFDDPNVLDRLLPVQ